MLQFLLTLTDESNHNKIEYIYNKYYENMLRYALSKFKSFGRRNFIYDAEDAVQNTFMRITKYIDKMDFSREEGEIKNYCFSILINEIYKVLGDNEENFEFFEEFCPENEYNFIESLDLQVRYQQVVRAIEALDEKYSITLQLVFCQEKTVGEIAEMMGISAKTVYTRLARGKKLLLDSLRGEN